MQESFFFVGLNTILWDLVLQLKRLIKLIMDWIILYRICDAFNGRYRIGDGIRERFNGKGGIGDGFDSTALARLAVCGLILNVNMYCGIDDILQQKKRIYH